MKETQEEILRVQQAIADARDEIKEKDRYIRQHKEDIRKTQKTDIFDDNDKIMLEKNSNIQGSIKSSVSFKKSKSRGKLVVEKSKSWFNWIIY